MNTKSYREGQQEVLIAIAEFLGQGGQLNAENFEEFAATYDPKPNPLSGYSLELLIELQKIYSANSHNSGKIVIEDVEYSYGEALEFVAEAIERREETDYCKHGVFKWTDHDIPCGACEFE